MSSLSAWINSLWESVANISWTTPDAATGLSWSLLHFLWQGTLIAIALGIALRLARKATSQYGPVWPPWP